MEMNGRAWKDSTMLVLQDLVNRRNGRMAVVRVEGRVEGEVGGFVKSTKYEQKAR